MLKAWVCGPLWLIIGMLFLLVAMTPPASAQTSDPLLVAAGDMSGCASNIDEATAALVEAIDGTVATLGDNVSPSTTAADFNNCYDPGWGRFKDRTYPAPGNREYTQPDATPYYDYFGERAGPRGKGYYSYDVGTWHIVVLNNYVDMSVGSEQERWLRADLAAHPARCTLAYWHEPRWTSGTGHADAVKTAPLWQALYDYGADLVLNGHEHHYERFARQNPSGQLDNTRGIRQIIVGTGGSGVYGFGTPKPNSEVRNSTTYGVLELTLSADSYSFRFVPIAGSTFTDSGRTTCSPLVGSQTPTRTTSPVATRTPQPTATRTPVPSVTRTPTRTATPAAASTSRTFNIEADARLVESTPDTKYGVLPTLRINGGAEPDEQSVLRVTVAGITRPIIDAKLRVYALSATTQGPSVYRIDSDWTEAVVVWNTRPALEGGVIDSVPVISANGWVEYDVTSVVTTNGSHAFALVGTSTDGIDLSSRQGSYPPQLVVTTR